MWSTKCSATCGWSTGNGAEVQLSAPKLRTLLALLLVNRGRPVSVDRIADTLWGRTPPRSAANLVQGYIRDLRQRLGAQEVATVPWEDTGWMPGGRLLMRSASRIWSSLAGMTRRWRCGTERPLRNVSTLPTRKAAVKLVQGRCARKLARAQSRREPTRPSGDRAPTPAGLRRFRCDRGTR